MSKVNSLLEDGLKSELLLQQQLKALGEVLRQQLQDTEKRQMEELEKRIHQNAVLSSGDIESGDGNGLNNPVERPATIPARNSDKDNLRQSDRSELSSSTWVSSTNRKHLAGAFISSRTHQCERLASLKSTQMIKEEEAEAECQKKFIAIPAPSSVTQPLYQKMMEKQDKERKQGLEQRMNFLLSIQKPFSFQEREKEKREKLIAMLKVNEQKNNTATGVNSHNVVKNLSEPELNEQGEVCRKVPTMRTVPQQNPTASGMPKLRTSERTRREKLGFLDEKPSFHPKITHQVPDFTRLHKNLQMEMMRKLQVKDGTKCQPFCLRTSALPARQRRTSTENSQVSKMSLTRSKSLGALTSLSSDTLPIYITDAARKRCMHIRNSMEERESKNQESTEWLRKYQLSSQAMSKTVNLHAKLLDPHSSLNEVYNEKIQHHRKADQLRMREYVKELQEIKARVRERPYLFEQLKQKNAKAHVELIFRNKLKEAGLKEQFVEEHAVEGIVTSSREENVDDWEQIEDVEEESVKSKGEEMP